MADLVPLACSMFQVIYAALEGIKPSFALAIGYFLVWLPRMDSNQRMSESESDALPLGYGAIDARTESITLHLQFPGNLGGYGWTRTTDPSIMSAVL